MGLFEFRDALNVAVADVLVTPLLNGRVELPSINPEGSGTFLASSARVDGPAFLELHERITRSAAARSLLEMARTDARVAHFMLSYVPGGMIAENERENAFYHNCTLIAALFESLHGINPQPAVFAGFFERVIAAEYRRRRVGVQKVLLSTIATSSSMRLSDDMIIRPVAMRERANWQSSGVRGNIPENAAVMEFRYSVKDDEPAFASTSERYESVRFACAYLGYPVPSDAAFETVEMTYRGMSGGYGTTKESEMARVPTQLSDVDLLKLRDALERVLNRSSQPKVALAMRRFVSAAHRRSTDDGLIDAWIALEALFGDGKSEMTFRIALRLAGYVGESPEERANIFQRAKESYGLRSRVVHGETGNIDVREYQWVLDMARRALEQIVKADERFVPHIEDRMLAGLVPAATAKR